MEFTHFDGEGNAWMVDVSEKKETIREAVAAGSIFMSAECFEKVRTGGMAKGDVLGVARIAGIMGAKKTSDLIPLCHILNLTKLSVEFELHEEKHEIRAFCTAKTTGRTGVEMEALTGVSTALLTIYDMCKAVDKTMEIGQIALLRKSGGKSGDFVRPAQEKNPVAECPVTEGPGSDGPASENGALEVTAATDSAAEIPGSESLGLEHSSAAEIPGPESLGPEPSSAETETADRSKETAAQSLETATQSKETAAVGAKTVAQSRETAAVGAKTVAQSKETAAVGAKTVAQSRESTDRGMELKKLPGRLTVCKVPSTAEINIEKDFYFIGKTDEELSLVCKTEDTPVMTTDRDDGWRGFRIQGQLDFSLIGILSELSAILARNRIGIFAVSTYNTDYILVKEENFEKAMRVLAEAGYRVV